MSGQASFFLKNPCVLVGLYGQPRGPSSLAKFLRLGRHRRSALTFGMDALSWRVAPSDQQLPATALALSGLSHSVGVGGDLVNRSKPQHGQLSRAEEASSHCLTAAFFPFLWGGATSLCLPLRSVNCT